MKGKEYIYNGDRIAKFYESKYVGKICFGVLKPNGKCIRGKNGNMLVMFDNELVNVPARMLRKTKK